MREIPARVSGRQKNERTSARLLCHPLRGFDHLIARFPGFRSRSIRGYALTVRSADEELPDTTSKLLRAKRKLTVRSADEEIPGGNSGSLQSTAMIMAAVAQSGKLDSLTLKYPGYILRSAESMLLEK